MSILSPGTKGAIFGSAHSEQFLKGYEVTLYAASEHNEPFPETKDDNYFGLL